MGFEDEVEQSFGRPCRQTNGRSKRTCELTSSIVPRGTSFHRSVELEFPPIGCDPASLSRCRSLFPGPAELGTVNPDAVHDHGQPAGQRDDCLFHPAAPGDLHRPGLEPRPFFRPQHASLIGRLGSSTFRLSTATVSMSLTGSCFSSESAPRPFHHGIRRRGGTIYWTALPSVERQVQATLRTHLIHRPARDIIPPLGGARVSSYRM